MLTRHYRLPRTAASCWRAAAAAVVAAAVLAAVEQADLAAGALAAQAAAALAEQAVAAAEATAAILMLLPNQARIQLQYNMILPQQPAAPWALALLVDMLSPVAGLHQVAWADQAWADQAWADQAWAWM
jgi:hypothetical protein